MASKPISQREARALKKRVRELEQREAQLRRAIGADYPGQYVARFTPGVELREILRTIARLGFVAVARLGYDGTEVHVYAVPTEVPRHV